MSANEQPASALPWVVTYSEEKDRLRAQRLADELGVSAAPSHQPVAAALALRYGDTGGLALHDLRQIRRRGLRASFVAPRGRYRSFPIARRGPLARALGRRTRQVVDATAGWGKDTARMMWMGIEVTAVERHPLMAALLDDALCRLARDRDFARHHLPTPRIVTGDAIGYLARLEQPAQCVFVDPMFPPKRNASAAAPRPLSLLRELVGDDSDLETLLGVAMTASRRVVVKRPDHAAPLRANPDESFAGKLVRYDVYLCQP